MRVLTAGESHGKCLVTIVEGLPSGLRITADQVNLDLARRQKGFGRGGRQALERDRVQILSGIRHGETLGSPISLLIPNLDWPNWEQVMNPADPGEPPTPVTRPRPGHADLPGCVKYSRTDIRDILERASARETAARVAAGALAKALLAEFNVQILSYVTAIGSVTSKTPHFDSMPLLTEESPVRCPDPEASSRMVEAIEAAREQGDTLGGVFEVLATNLPPGLGSHVHWDRRLDGILAGALMAINGIKGVEIGLGFTAAALPGSRVHDPIYRDAPPPWHYSRPSNNAGGLEGGITNGETVLLRAAMKPIATMKRPLASVDMASKTPVAAHHERSDVCAVPSAAVVGEAVVALSLAEAFLDKFGRDSLGEVKAAYDSYMKNLSYR